MLNKLSSYNIHLYLLPIVMMMLCGACSKGKQMDKSDFEGAMNTSELIQHKINILEHIQHESFIIYSFNMGEDIHKTIQRQQSNILRSYLHQALSTGIIIDDARYNCSATKDCFLRVRLAPQAYHGKNVELIFPQIQSKRVLLIEIEKSMLLKIQQWMGIKFPWHKL